MEGISHARKLLGVLWGYLPFSNITGWCWAVFPTLKYRREMAGTALKHYWVVFGGTSHSQTLLGGIGGYSPRPNVIGGSARPKHYRVVLGGISHDGAKILGGMGGRRAQTLLDGVKIIIGRHCQRSNVNIGIGGVPRAHIIGVYAAPL